MTFVPFISREKIDIRVAQLGKEIARDYAGKKPLFICVLNGAFPFAADLFRHFPEDAEIEFIRLKSYSGTASTGTVKHVMGLNIPIKDRHVIIVEDIVDTGRTLHNLIAELGKQQPASLKTASLLFKPEALETDTVPEYVGFSIPRKFIIGFGLDIDELARNLNDIYVLKQD